MQERIFVHEILYKLLLRIDMRSIFLVLCNKQLIGESFKECIKCGSSYISKLEGVY